MKDDLKNLVCNSVKETLNTLFDKEVDRHVSTQRGMSVLPIELFDILWDTPSV